MIDQVKKAIPEIINILNQASVAILKIYNSDKSNWNIEAKSDESPLTIADQNSHIIIQKGLSELFPNIPIISEEGTQADFEERKNWSIFWLVDPLDGTKEFIKRNGEFTINIGLIINNKPVIGFLAVPTQDKIYYSDGEKSYLLENNLINEIKCSNKKTNLTSVGSRSHKSEDEANALSKFDITQTIEAGSALKFCMIAEGKAEIYYRQNPTMEWDTAAGEAIVLSAGGKIEGITYNKPELINSSFLCTSGVF